MMDKILLIGLGKMGTAIATRILAGGFSLVVYNRTPGKAQTVMLQMETLTGSVNHALSLIKRGFY